MKKYLLSGVTIALLSSTTSLLATTEIDIFSDAEVKGEIRTRYENVNADNGKDDASALTNRIQLGINAKLFNINGLSTYIEMTNVANRGDLNDLSNNQANYQVVADPAQTRVTQAYIDYKMGKTLIRAGRQGVNLDNQRFVGTVNWRQMPQTYDAIAIVDNSVDNLHLLAAYVDQVNLIKKDSFDTGTVLLHGDYTATPEVKITGYGYLIEDIHDTIGVALSGKVSMIGNTKIQYRAEYAKQMDPSLTNTKPNQTADADYYNIEASTNSNGLLVGAKYEVLSAGNGGNGSFSTPLATLYAHNGWSDQFLTGTPPNGLVDANIMLGYKAKNFGVAKIIYHDFTAEDGGASYGNEIDLLYKTKISTVKGLSGMLRAGLYSTDTHGVDTSKYWAMMDYKF